MWISMSTTLLLLYTNGVCAFCLFCGLNLATAVLLVAKFSVLRSVEECGYLEKWIKIESSKMSVLPNEDIITRLKNNNQAKHEPMAMFSWHRDIAFNERACAWWPVWWLNGRRYKQRYAEEWKIIWWGSRVPVRSSMKKGENYPIREPNIDHVCFTIPIIPLAHYSFCIIIIIMHAFCPKSPRAWRSNFTSPPSSQ